MRDFELFSNGGVYHVYNRGVDRRDIFTTDRDRVRFCKSMIAFNEVGRSESSSLARVDVPYISENPCVDVMAYCLMMNHFHLMLRQVSSGGISEFMQRMGSGYTQYFNKTHERVGRLFEGPYKIKRMKNSIQLRHLSRYIHLNPLETRGIDYKAGPVAWSNVEPILNAYRWSSYRHYVGLECQLLIRQDEAMQNIGDPKDYKRFLRGWVERDWKILDTFDPEC